MVILLQTLQVISCMLSSWVRNKRWILIFNFINSVFCCLLYLYIGRFDSLSSKLISTLRNLLFMFRDRYKSNIILVLVVLAYTTSGVLTYKDLYSLIPCFTPIIVSFVYWYGDAKTIKIICNLLDSVWLFYFAHFGLYVVLINTVVNIVIRTVSLTRNGDTYEIKKRIFNRNE